MKNYKNLEELNKAWGKLGFRINEKGELLGIVDDKEYKYGKATFCDENGKPLNQKEIKEAERERERETKTLKDK